MCETLINMARITYILTKIKMFCRKPNKHNYYFLWRFWFICWLVIHVGIQDSIGRYQCVGLKRANEIIGTTTEELVLKARQGNLTTWWRLQNMHSSLMYMLVLVNNDNLEISRQFFSLKNARLMSCLLDGSSLHFCFLLINLCISHICCLFYNFIPFPIFLY